jgi:hypothetical protein
MSKVGNEHVHDGNNVVLNDGTGRLDTVGDTQDPKQIRHKIEQRDIKKGIKPLSRP